jgi:hypothetical protein
MTNMAIPQSVGMWDKYCQVTVQWKLISVWPVCSDILWHFRGRDNLTINNKEGEADTYTNLCISQSCTRAIVRTCRQLPSDSHQLFHILHLKQCLISKPLHCLLLKVGTTRRATGFLYSLSWTVRCCSATFLLTLHIGTSMNLGDIIYLSKSKQLRTGYSDTLL